ncbi:MAG: hypothetical protein R2690_02360 [Acidimicrobiales bacterium]
MPGLTGRAVATGASATGAAARRAGAAGEGGPTHRDAGGGQRRRRLLLEHDRCQEGDGGEHGAGREPRALPLVARRATGGVTLDELQRVGVEGVEPGAGQRGAQLGAGRCAVTPQDPGAHGAIEPATHPVHQLVGGVAVHAEHVADLGRAHAVAQLEVQDLGVPFTQRLDRAPQQRRGLVVLGDAGRVVERAEAVLDAEAGRPGVARAERTAGAGAHDGHPGVVERRGALLAFASVEGLVAADPQDPSAERARVGEVVDVAPRREEAVLGDLGRHLVVAHDAAGDVEATVEPGVVEAAERVGVAAAGLGDPGGVARAVRVALVAVAGIHAVVIVAHLPVGPSAGTIW